MTLKIISTTEILFEGTVKLVSLPGTMGRFAVLKNHASLISTLTPGLIRFKTDDSDKEGSFTINGGLADIDKNVISVCVY